MSSSATLSPPTDIVRFTNGYLALKDGTAIKADLYVSPSLGTIVSGQVSYFTNQIGPIRTIDLDGGILSPGLIDVQINGAYGVDFSELDPAPGGEDTYLAGLDKVSKRIVETGTTSYVPTIITQKEELYAKVSPPSRDLANVAQENADFYCSAPHAGKHAEDQY